MTIVQKPISTQKLKPLVLQTDLFRAIMSELVKRGNQISFVVAFSNHSLDLLTHLTLIGVGIPSTRWNEHLHLSFY